MAATYEPIATVTASGSSSTQVIMSSIPDTYTDLILIIQSGNAGPDDLSMRFNSDTGANYSATTLSGTGSAAQSTRFTNATGIQLDERAYNNNTLTRTTIVQIMNYSNTTTYKTALSRANNASTGVDAIVGMWRNTAKITAISVFSPATGYNILAGSTFTLYGIKAA